MSLFVYMRELKCVHGIQFNNVLVLNNRPQGRIKQPLAIICIDAEPKRFTIYRIISSPQHLL